MQRLKLWIIGALAASLTLAVIAGVSAQGGPPGPSSFPSIFQGTVTETLDSLPPVQTGLTVEAYIDGRTEPCNSGNAVPTYRNDGESVTRYFVRVEHNNLLAGCGQNGDEVRFKIGDRWATQRGTFDNSSSIQQLNLTLGAETVTIQVAVWRRNIEPVGALAISTRAPGGNWSTGDWPLDMSERSASGRWNRSEITPVDVTLSGGETVTIEVAVWRRNIEPVGALAISTRAPGRSWTTGDWPLDMSEVSASGRWNRSEITPVEVELE
ncbi:MAG: hypothetical protein CL897_02560 [Dehalococcoidia bacterium]|nr:hypothetical protein [Dehalococcoidia bacterium]HCV00702.1 hypothetical protein [Dehalococcoidia bacterium]|tara:strand:- start:6974 stop:7774 length:801 start_codon:yes stop_codon:yes gene_type:complete